MKGVAGRGHTQLTQENVKKKSILSITNDDNLCLPRSLATAYAYVVRGQYEQEDYQYEQEDCTNIGTLFVETTDPFKKEQPRSF